MKDQNLKMMNLHVSHTLGCSRNGIPKDRDEVNRREVCERDGGVCDLDMMGDPSKLSVIRKAASLVKVSPTLLLSWTEKAARR